MSDHDHEKIEQSQYNLKEKNKHADMKMKMFHNKKNTPSEKPQYIKVSSKKQGTLPLHNGVNKELTEKSKNDICQNVN